MEKLLAFIPAIIQGIRESIKIIGGGGRYRRFFEKSNAMFMIASIEGRILCVNIAFAHELGYEPEQLVGKAFMAYVHTNDHQKTMNAMDVLREGGEIPGGVFHNRYICRDKTLKMLEWIAVGNGEIYAFARVIATK